MARTVSRLLPFWILISIAGAQTNILNNGGFEYGLMCYSHWIWSQTGIDGKGDHRLFLSTDAHSGNYSLEIRCTGSDCAMGAVYTNQIQTAPNQDYRLKVWSKCPTGQIAAAYLPETANGEQGQLLTCNGEWAENVVNFRSSATAKSFAFALYYYNKDWARFDDVVLSYADGTAPQEIVMYPGTRNVSTGNKSVMVDGSPYLSLGFFDVGYDDLAAVAATGANTAVQLGRHPAANCFSTGQTSFLDRAYQVGVNVVPTSSSTTVLGNPSAYANAIRRFAPHLANVAWMLSDEPDLPEIGFIYVPGPDFVAAYNAAKTATTLPLFADFQRAAWSVPEEVSPYMNGVDFWMAEPYGGSFSGVTHATSLFNSLKPRPIWLAQDAIDANLIVPKAYWAIINGATGITYFTWGEFKADVSKLAAARQVFSELQQLKNVIFSQNIDAQVTATPGIGFTSRLSAGSTYILAANPQSSTVAATFRVQGLAAGQQIQVLFENRTITSAAGEFTDPFAGVSRHVYAIGASRTTLSSTLTMKSGPDNARVWTIQVNNAGPGAASSARIAGVGLRQTGGPACNPVLTTPLPVVVGDIPAAKNATANLTFNFTGCDGTARFTSTFSLSANAGGVTATTVRNNERK